MTALEGRDSTDAQHEVVEREEFLGFLLIAGKAMEHAARKVFLILSEQMYHLVLRLAAMNHQWQAGIYRPLHLLFESLQLLMFELTAPIVIQSDFANGDKVGKLHLPEFCQLLLPVFLHLFRVQANHGIGVARIFPAQSQDCVRGLQVDGRQEHLAYPRFTGTSESLRPILIKFLRIKMRMRIYYFEH